MAEQLNRMHDVIAGTVKEARGHPDEVARPDRRFLGPHRRGGWRDAALVLSARLGRLLWRTGRAQTIAGTQRGLSCWAILLCMGLFLPFAAIPPPVRRRRRQPGGRPHALPPAGQPMRNCAGELGSQLLRWSHRCFAGARSPSASAIAVGPLQRVTAITIAVTIASHRPTVRCAGLELVS
jgi:hypothetical protein